MNRTKKKKEEMCGCQGNPLARVALFPYKQGLSNFEISYRQEFSVLNFKQTLTFSKKIKTQILCLGSLSNKL